MEILTELIEEGDPEKIATYMKENGLVLLDGKIFPSSEKKEWVESQITFWDQRQQAR